jgi:hypothetical protein
MQDPASCVSRPRRLAPKRLTFTPTEWRQIIDDKDFLNESDNQYKVPRRLMGVPVEIVPDHDF